MENDEYHREYAVLHRRLTARLALLLSAVCLAGAATEARAESLMPVNVLSAEEIDPVAFRREQRALARDCRKLSRVRRDLAEVIEDEGFDRERIAWIAQNLWLEDMACPRDQDLAVALLEAAFGSDPLANRGMIDGLIYYYEQMARPGTEGRLFELRQIQWLCNSVRGNLSDLQLDRSARLALAARDDVWDLISNPATISSCNGHSRSLLVEALLAPESSRYDLDQALAEIENGRGSEHTLRAIDLALARNDDAAMRARAETMLWNRMSNWEAAQSRLLDFVIPRFNSQDQAERSAGAEQMLRIALGNGQTAAQARRQLIPYYGGLLASADSFVAQDAAAKLSEFYRRFGDEALTPLRPWLERKLRGSESERQQAMALLELLLREAKPEARDILDAHLAEAYARQGGLREGGQLTFESSSIARFILDPDYPSRAAREGRTGLVSMSAIVGPDGRVVDATPIGDPDPMLANSVRVAAMRRIRLPTFPNQGGAYVRVTLPVVQFSQSGCADVPEDPNLPGAIVVGFVCVTPVD